MRPSKPRIQPLEEAAWDAEQRDLLGPVNKGWGVLNIFKTLAHHPKLLKRWLPFANHILFKSSLAPREREIVILRVGWLCRAEYEWGQHVEIAKRAGLNNADIARIAEGPDAPGWTPLDAALLRAVGELRADARITDATWAKLSARYDTRQLMDLVFTVGNYTLVAMALNTFGVTLEEGVRGFPD